MKIKWQHPEAPETGKRYFRSMGELRDTPEFRGWLETEFPAMASELSERESETTRRSFLQYMGASAALMGFGMASCRRPEAKIVPFAHHVEWSIPGKPVYYSSSVGWGDDALGLVVTTHDGRPTYITGNCLHPDGGGLDARGSAMILDMYEPSRSRVVLHQGKESSLADFQAELKKQEKTWAASQGKGLGLVINPGVSPTRDRLLTALKAKYPALSIYRYDALARTGMEAAAAALYGPGSATLPKLSEASVIFSLDCDFLGLERLGGKAESEFMAGRKCETPEDPMNRLYVVENRFTLTGGMADHRLNLPASLLFAATVRLAAQLGVPGMPAAEGLTETQQKWIDVAATDLKAQGAKAVVLAGGWQAPAIHAVTALINEALGSKATQVSRRTVIEAQGINELRAAVEKSELQTVFFLQEGDPVYDAGDWEQLHRRIPSTVHLGVRLNATAHASTWHINGAHVLERWGDSQSLTGVYSVTQPMISPLFGGLSEIDLLLALLGGKELVPAAPEAGKEEAAPAPKAKDPSYLAVRETFAALAEGDANAAWTLLLRNGFHKTEGVVSPAQITGDAAALIGAHQKLPTPALEAFEVVFAPDHGMWDGRFIDNAWLHEAPDPITKMTWGNVAQINPHTFRELGLEEDGQIVDITLHGKTLSIPAVLAPGHARHSVTLTLGYGQKFTGPVGRGHGVDVNPLRTRLDGHIVPGGKVVKGSGKVVLSTTAEHFSMEGRALAREGTLEDFKHKDDFAQFQGEDSHIPPNKSLYKGLLGKKSEKNPEGFDYDLHQQWGMVIDLNACTGCNACLIACQSENNIPVVGPDQVINGREMHWVRLDRYFSIVGDTLPRDEMHEKELFDQLDNPEMIVQPVSCVQCESAPCETVCPVNATVHSEEGLNLMAYNRCIGTRYCANNCPYKARRFNYFDYNKRDVLAKKEVAGKEFGNLYFGPLGDKAEKAMTSLGRNPNVTVRMRGVMEKCTYCIQRLEEAKIEQRAKAGSSNNVKVPENRLKVACQESCSCDAIAFGDLSQEDSRVSKWKKNPRNYTLLKYIGTEPRTTYLARIKNPYTTSPLGPMPGSEHIGKATSSHH